MKQEKGHDFDVVGGSQGVVQVFRRVREWTSSVPWHLHGRGKFPAGPEGQWDFLSGGK